MSRQIFFYQIISKWWGIIISKRLPLKNSNSLQSRRFLRNERLFNDRLGRHFESKFNDRLGRHFGFKPIVLSLGIIFCLAPTLCQFHYSRWRHIGLFIARPGYSSLAQQNTPALQATSTWKRINRDPFPIPFWEFECRFHRIDFLAKIILCFLRLIWVWILFTLYKS